MEILRSLARAIREEILGELTSDKLGVVRNYYQGINSAIISGTMEKVTCLKHVLTTQAFLEDRITWGDFH